MRFLNKTPSIKVSSYIALVVFAILVWYRFDLSLWCFVLLALSMYIFSLARQRFDYISSLFMLAFVLSGITLLLYIILGLFHVQFTPLIFSSFTLLILLTMWCLQIRPGKAAGISRHQKIIQCSLIAGTIGIIIFLILPFFSVDPSQRVNLLSIGEDNISHFALFHAVMEHGLTNSSSDVGIISGLRDYPQGMHAIYAGMSKMLVGTNVNLNTLINSYIFFAALGYSLLILSIVYIGQKLLLGTKSIVLGSVGSLLLMAGISFGLVFYLFTHGFHTQIFSYFFLMITPITISNLHSDQAKYIFFSLTFVLLCYSWYILVLILGIYALLLLYTKRLTFPDLKTILYMLPIIFIGLTFFIRQPAVHDGGNALLLGGAVVHINMIDLLLVLVGGAISLLMHKSITKGPSYLLAKSMIFLSISSFVVVILVGSYQLLKIHHFAYFYYKSLYLPYMIFLMLSLVALINIGIYVLENKLLSRKVDNLLSVLLIFLLVFAVIKAMGQPYPSGYAHKTLITAVDYNAITTIYNRPISSQSDVIYPDNCESYSRYITMRWVGALLLNDNDSRHTYQLSFLNNVKNENQNYFNKKINEGAVVLNSQNCNP